MDNGEEQTNTVFVGSIAPDTDDRALRDFFNQFGRVLETKVHTVQSHQQSFAASSLCSDPFCV